MRRATIGALGAIVVAAGLGLPSAAQAQSAAGQVSIVDGVVKFRAAPDQVNDIYITQYGADIYLDDVKPITPGPGCWHPDADMTLVFCNDAPGGVEARLGDRSDFLYLDVPGADTAWGGRGHDEIVATGYDTVFGEVGNDSVYSARYQYGGDGIDWLVGSGRFNRLEGGKNDDNIFGEDGPDKLYGGSGDDQITGNWGYDQIYGGDGQDLLSGGRGNDKMWGGAHSDSLYGGSDNDLLRGGPGSDYLYGGPGSDRTYQ